MAAGNYWVKWRYMDHGHKDWQELEIPAEYDDPRGWICELDLVPTWSERYTPDRIKVERIERPSRETLERLIEERKTFIEYAKSELSRLERMLKAFRNKDAKRGEA